MYEFRTKLGKPQEAIIVKKNKFTTSDILVVTTKKSFWKSKESKNFPNIIYSWIIGGTSTWRHNSLILFIRAIIKILVTHPRLVLIGSAPRLNPWFAHLKKMGLLKKTKLICICHLEFGYRLVPFFDKIIVYSSKERDVRDSKSPVKNRYHYIPLPASLVNDLDFSEEKGSFIFSGGRAKRDYGTLIEAVCGLNIKLKLVTRDDECVKHGKEIPQNIEIEHFKPLNDFLQNIKDSKFVVVPLFRGEEWSHGQTTIVQAMRLGKTIISNNESSVNDYIVNNKNGILVEPENPKALQDAIRHLIDNPKEVERLGHSAKKTSEQFTDFNFAKKLEEICLQVMNQE